MDWRTAMHANEFLTRGTLKMLSIIDQNNGGQVAALDYHDWHRGMGAN